MKSVLNYKLLIVLFIVGALSSCDDKIRELEDLNSAPLIQYFQPGMTEWENAKPDLVITDSVKVWNNSNNATYPLLLHIFDHNYNLDEIKISSQNPDLSFFVNDASYIREFKTKEFVEEYNLAFRHNKNSLEEFKVSAVDDFGATNTLTLRLKFIDNLLPVSALQIILKSGKDRMYQLYGQGSYDKDQKYGGKIVEYEFVIDNVVINTTQPNIFHIFAVGDHVVKLRVKDNDNVWSEYATQYVTVK